MDAGLGVDQEALKRIPVSCFLWRLEIGSVVDKKKIPYWG